MKQHYKEILKQFGAKLPVWFDEHGVPRWCEFAPGEVADIYADQVLLVKIECQQCEQVFLVAFSWTKNSIANIMARANGLPTNSLFEDAAQRAIYYGDPPNVRCCSAGPTMTSVTKGIVQAWHKDGTRAWERVADMEGDWPDDNTPD